MKKLLITLITTTIVITGCNSGGIRSSGSNRANLTYRNSSNQIIKAAYLDMSAATAYDAVQASGISSANIIIFGFADTTTSIISDTQVKQIQKTMSSEGANTTNLLSLGGEYANPTTFNTSTVQQIASNVIKQINDFNSKNTVKIDGVDLDLEQGISSETIAALAKTFKQQGLKVGAAPQVYLKSGYNIDSTNPNNMVLTSGGGVNTYQAALNSGNIDYLFVQTYNTSGFTIDGVDEESIAFFKNTAKALNNVVNTQCTGTDICIPSTTKIVIGTVANKYAGGYTPFMNNATPTDQQALLTQLKADIESMSGSSEYRNFAGVMVWSLNMDYAANLYASTNVAYIQGGFSSTVFGAAPSPTTPYFILQVYNTGPDAPSKGAYSSATLVVKGAYYPFGTSWNAPIAPNTSQLWGTLSSANNSGVPGVIDSSTLDQFFTQDATSFTTDKIIINGYRNQNQDLGNTDVQYDCAKGKGYTFIAGHAYNLMINAAYGSCDIKQII